MKKLESFDTSKKKVTITPTPVATPTPVKVSPLKQRKAVEPSLMDKFWLGPAGGALASMQENIKQGKILPTFDTSKGNIFSKGAKFAANIPLGIVNAIAGKGAASPAYDVANAFKTTLKGKEFTYKDMVSPQFKLGAQIGGKINNKAAKNMQIKQNPEEWLGNIAGTAEAPVTALTLGKESYLKGAALEKETAKQIAKNEILKKAPLGKQMLSGGTSAAKVTAPYGFISGLEQNKDQPLPKQILRSLGNAALQGAGGFAIGASVPLVSKGIEAVKGLLGKNKLRSGAEVPALAEESQKVSPETPAPKEAVQTIGDIQTSAQAPELTAYEKAINTGDTKTIMELANKNPGDARFHVHENVPGLMNEVPAGTGSPKLNPVEKIMEALKGAKPVRGQQEALYTAERTRRLTAAEEALASSGGGEAGYKAQLGALKGELPKSQFSSVRNSLDQTDIDGLFNMIDDSPKLSGYEKITAKNGLTKLVGESGGRVPTDNELSLMEKVYGTDFVNTVMEKRPVLDQMVRLGTELVNVPKSLMSTADFSGSLRQAAFLAPTHPKQFAKAFVEQFKYFLSDKYYRESMQEIANRPSFNLMKQSDLAIQDVGSSFATQREEAFMSNLAEKIPVIGRLIKASDRAYTGFLARFRADTFDSFVNQYDLNVKPDEAKAFADFVNNATGRGSLGGLENASKVLNAVFFSPRLMASRFNLLTPTYYIKLPPAVRAEALKSAAGFAGMVMSAAGLGSLAGGDVELDPTSSDFLKIRFGNTRLDPGAGFTQYIRAGAQILSGRTKSSTTGKVIELGKGYKANTRRDVLLNFFEGKLGPGPSFVDALLKGKDFSGQDLNVPNEVVKRFIPMIMQDGYDLYNDNPQLLPLILFAIFGVGVQTYPSTKPGTGRSVYY